MPIANNRTYSIRPGGPIYGGRQAPPPNELRVSLPTGAETNYPLQFGRAFAAGAISGEPSVSLDGVVMALQQCDIKTRYADGSVKFAVISVVIPSLTTVERVLSIGNKAAATRTPETIANMLANYDFDAKIDVKVSGVSVTGAPASARTYLQTLSDATLAANTAAHSPDSRYWTQGPVCTTVILGDHTAKTLDLGTTATKTMRPVFYVQFWPSLNKYRVRHVLEIADVTKLRGDTGLNVIFSTGNTAPVERLNQASVSMAACTWESREFWSGTELPQVNIKHDMNYLRAVQVMPNYDTSIQLHQPALDDYRTAFAAMDKSLGASGAYTKAMPTTGGRHDLGVFNKWELLAIWSGQAHMIEYLTKHSEFAGAWTMYWREGSAAKTFINSVNGQGRCVTKFGRPTQFIAQLDGQHTDAADKFTYEGGPGDARGWDADTAHAPSLFYVPYLMTGGAFWYEKIQQIAAWGMFNHQSALGYNSVSSGDSGSRMLLGNLQVRGFAWQYRNRARAWWAALDGSPDKLLMQRAMDEATAMRCGIHGVDDFIGDPVRESWNANYLTWSEGRAIRPNALGFLTPNDGYSMNDIGGAWPADSDQRTTSPWMVNFVAASLGHAVELGYTGAVKLQEFSVRLAIQMCTSTDPRQAGAFAMPSGKIGGTFYQSAAELLSVWTVRSNSPDIPETSVGGFLAGGAPNTSGVTSFNYGNHAAMAVAMANGVPNQAAAWAFLAPYHDNTYYYNHDPRTAVIPRN